MSVNFVVFSKNRACQLDLLLRSATAMFKEIATCRLTVLYKATGVEYQRGYELVGASHERVALLPDDPRQPINRRLRDILDDRHYRFCSMLVDDDVFVRPFSATDRPFVSLDDNPSIAAVSTRLHPRVTYCQPLGVTVAPPHIDPNGVFKWGGDADGFRKSLRRAIGLPPRGEGDWDCKMSMDGNIYLRDDLLECFTRMPDVERVGDLELAMRLHPIARPNGACYARPRLINVPLNRVDDSEHAYPSMGQSADAINARFLAGERIEHYDLPEQIDFRSCHIEAMPVWMPRPAR